MVCCSYVDDELVSESSFVTELSAKVNVTDMMNVA